jgi:hypothetical protein
MVIVVDESRGCGLMMRLNVAVDDIGMRSIVGATSMDVLGWKQSQAEHTQHRKARNRPAQNAVQHDDRIIGGRRRSSQTGKHQR